MNTLTASILDPVGLLRVSFCVNKLVSVLDELSAVRKVVTVKPVYVSTGAKSKL